MERKRTDSSGGRCRHAPELVVLRRLPVTERVCDDGRVAVLVVLVVRRVAERVCDGGLLAVLVVLVAGRLVRRVGARQQVAARVVGEAQFAPQPVGQLRQAV